MTYKTQIPYLGINGEFEFFEERYAGEFYVKYVFVVYRKEEISFITQHNREKNKLEIIDHKRSILQRNQENLKDGEAIEIKEELDLRWFNYPSSDDGEDAQHKLCVSPRQFLFNHRLMFCMYSDWFHEAFLYIKKKLQPINFYSIDEPTYFDPSFYPNLEEIPKKIDKSNNVEYIPSHYLYIPSMDDFVTILASSEYSKSFYKFECIPAYYLIDEFSTGSTRTIEEQQRLNANVRLLKAQLFGRI